MEIKEKPILFSGPMVRAILRGDKTQTRRVINPQPDSEEEGEPYWNIGGFRLHQSSSKPLICPYGNPGDILWVREAWRGSRENDKIHLSYCADGTTRIVDSNSAKHNLSDYIFPRAASNPKNAVSPLFMPRWASRITLKITGISVQRLQDICQMDAWAEGCPEDRIPDGLGRPYAWFRDLWNCINSKRGYGWDSDPWVWKICFERAMEGDQC
jgi:hypothetical protein